MFRHILRVACLVVALCGITIPVNALAFGITPPTFSIRAARGSTFRAEVTLQKESDSINEDIPISVVVASELKDVITIAEPRFIIPAGQIAKKYELRGVVSPNLANGIHRVRVMFRQEQPIDADVLRITGETGAAAQLVMQLPLNLVLDVTGEQVISYDFLAAEIDPTEVDLPFVLNAQFWNKGTVAWKPDQLLVRLSPQGVPGQVFEFRIPVLEYLDPGATFTYQLPQTHSLPFGRYLGTATVVEKGVEKDQHPIPPFDVYAAGYLSKKIEIQSVSTDRAVYPIDDEAVVEVVMQNTGTIRAKARVTVELYLEGAKVDTQVSAEQVVERGDTGLVRLRFPSLKRGNYEVKAYVDYEGKTTPLSVKTFAVVERPPVVAPIVVTE